MDCVPGDRLRVPPAPRAGSPCAPRKRDGDPGHPVTDTPCEGASSMTFRPMTQLVKSHLQSRGPARGRRAAVVAIERMEDRMLLATWWVTNTGDNGGVNPAPLAGTGTLRQAIIDANADTDAAGAFIAFNIPASD